MTTETELVELRLAHEQEMIRLAAQGMLWAIVDACNEPVVLEKVQQIGEGRARCLFRGDAQQQKEAVAPYLFHLDGELLSWINQTLAGKPWGVFVAAQADSATLERHFRSMLMVRGPEGHNLYFRFYDPRVLEMYLGQSNEQDVRRFYGPVRGYGISGPGPQEVTFRVTKASAEQGQPAATQIEIRRQQMDFFDAKVNREADARTVQKLAADKGELSDEQLQAKVSRYLHEGRESGLTRERALAHYAALRLKAEGGRG
ncbi:MAG: DUF4123 domain-containing protein [Bryobacterales bacterium]|nr:DUF4123 domain-containing protein [Bryobacterales bacterium]